MSQKRNKDAAALIKRIATIAGAVPDFAFDAGAAVVIWLGECNAGLPAGCSAGVLARTNS